MTAPDQCCSSVRKFLPRRRPHMTHTGHERAAFAAMHSPDLLYSQRSLGLGQRDEAARVHHAPRRRGGGVAARGQYASLLGLPLDATPAIASWYDGMEIAMRSMGRPLFVHFGDVKVLGSIWRRE